jgi:hypothetical protein
MSTMSVALISWRPHTRPAWVLVVSVAILASATVSVDARRHWRHYYRAIESNHPAAENHIPGSLGRGWYGYGRRYSRHDRRNLPTNILALVPLNWREQVAEANQGEYRFASPQGDAWITLSGRPAEEKSPDEYLRSFAFVDGEDITYLRRERDRLVSFGFKDDKHERKFYRKVMLSCDGHRWRHLTVEYPVTTRSPFEQLIDDLSEVMDFTKDTGCAAARSSSRELALSPDQQRCVYGSVPKFVKAELRMRLALGAEVPRDVKLFNFPGETYACDARLANFRYVVVEGQVVIVDPADYSIVDAISP